MKLDLIVGARPNFIKIAPIIKEIKNANLNGIKIEYRLIHTGQHYDKKMSESFFKDLDIPNPHINLKAGGGSQAEQTAKIMIGYERLLKKEPSGYCMVVGDVNSTLACAIVAKKAKMKLIHVEAGIRSWDISMPEEINRIVTDSLTDYFFTTSKTANKNLFNLGIDSSKIFLVGNTMIDTLLAYKNKFQKPPFWDEIGLKNGSFIIMTVHRPANVDSIKNLNKIISNILISSQNFPIIFPVHPRTLKQIQKGNISRENIYFVEPLSYLEFNYLVKHAKAVITDSGGVSEETTVMNIPCLTLRNSTERPETVQFGTNELLSTDSKKIRIALSRLFSGKWKKGEAPYLWDGNSSKRIIKHLINIDKAR